MNEHVPAVVIGAGQAGLATSYLLKQRGIAHVVLEQHRIAHAWRTQRWDSFCLVTPNWQCALPGFPYSGNDPDGFMVKDQIIDYLDAYAAAFGPPVREGVTVTNLALAEHGFCVTTDRGAIETGEVVVAVGGYHATSLPRLAERFATDVVQLHSSMYKNAASLPPGDVLVVGSGQSGAQIAEDLHLAGRTVHLCVGSAPRCARFYRGRDVVAWLYDAGYYDLTVENHPLKERVRQNPNHYLTGRDGGRDIDLRAFARDGMRLYGRLANVAGDTLTCEPNLRANLDRADEVADSIKTTIDAFIEKNGIIAPAEARYVPVWEPGEESTSLDYRAAGITSVIWCVGFGSNYRWIDVPVFDGKGYPCHRRGVTNVPGLYFLGLPWLHTWGSGRFSGIARDATFVADRIESRQRAAGPRATERPNALALGS